MKLSAVLVSLFLASASASADKAINLVDGTISSNSDLGRNLLSKARQLNDNNNNNYYYSWIVDYSIKFDGCAAVPQFEREEGLSSTLLAKFKLCPTDKCKSCPNAGEYIVDMREFVEAYQEAQETANEAACETAEETCEYNCENGYYQANQNDDGNNNDQNNNNNNNQDDDEYCKYQCLVDQGMGFCDQDGDDVDLEEFAECRAMNDDDNNNNNNNNNYNYNGGSSSSQVYYTGAYCTSAGVFAEVFADSACTKKAPSGTYEKYNYGYSLPTEPLVPSGCISSCEYQSSYDDDNNGNNNDNNNNGILEVCENLYEQSVKCEKKVKNAQYQDNSGCDMIHKVVPRLNSAFKSLNGGPQLATVCAWLFGIALVGLSAYVYLLHKKVIRQKVDLSTLGLGFGSKADEDAVGVVS